MMSAYNLGNGVFLLVDARRTSDRMSPSKTLNWQAELAYFKGALQKLHPDQRVIWIDTEGCRSGRFDCIITVVTETK